MYKYSAKEIVGLLDHKIDQVVSHLFSNGKRKGNEWCVGSIHGEVGESLKICMTGDKIGVWSDFATGQSGDLLNLWCLSRNKTISEAILEVRQWLGIPSTTFEPERRSQWVQPEIKSERILQSNSRASRYLIYERKLTFETLNKYQIRETQNEIVFPYYVEDKLVLIKYLQIDRPKGKKEMRVTPNSKPCLFGWQVIPKDARAVVLVEGEIDAMSLYQFGIGIAILSVPFGGGKEGKQQWLEHEFDRLAVFDDIYLCLDNDIEGQTATTALIERLGRYRCRVVKLPYKDANECLQKGVHVDEIQKCFDNAAVLDPVELKAASRYVEEVIDEFYPPNDQVIGYDLPWEKTKNKIILKPDQLSLWTGYNGHGKSQLLGHVILHAMQQGAKVCIASLELKPKRLLARLTRQAGALRLPTPEYIRAIHQWYDNHLWIFDLVGTTKTVRLLEVFKYARQRYDIDVFVIDSLMKCGVAEDDYNAQKLFIDQLCDFKNEHNCHVHLVAHPRKGADENKLPGKLDMKGSGSISDLADNCFGVFRNKLKEDEINKLAGKSPPSEGLLEKYDCLLSCDKQRNGEWEGKIALWFDPDSFQYLENRHLRAIQMISYSSRQIQE
jgi:twinkle protein